MAATAPPLQTAAQERAPAASGRRVTGILVAGVLTPLVIAVNGYHPYAEDGGLYLAGVKRVLDPSLYLQWSGFTTAHLRFSLFAPVVGWLVHATHLGLMSVMLLLYMITIWATLLAGWEIAVRCYSQIVERLGSVTLLALLLTVPVAGTSLMLMDPYVSARSISTPSSLFALVAVMDIARQIRLSESISVVSGALCLGSLFVAALVHPLMAIYGLGCAVVLAIVSAVRSRPKQVMLAGLSLTVLAAAYLLFALAPATPAGYMEVARTRSYWFVDEWHWYEIAGLAAPLLVIGLVAYRTRVASREPLRNLALAGLFAGALAIVVALLFARSTLSSYEVAKVQPLRVFQTIYVITIIMVGAALGRYVLKRAVWRWATTIAMVGGSVLTIQIQSVPNSSHIEVPGLIPANGWEQAFAWMRTNTPKDAVFAIDANYINLPGEDAQNFRAIAERSVVPDYSKDGGVAAIAPDLTGEWLAGERAQKNLDTKTDAQRLEALRGYGARWIVLPSSASTQFHCDYANRAAKVCRLP